MNKKIKLVFLLAFIVIFSLVSCKSSPEEEFTPLDYTQEDIIQNEIATITEMLETQPLKALWRATLLKNNSPQSPYEMVGNLYKSCGETLLSQYQKAVDDGNNLQSHKILTSLIAVDYPLDESLIGQVRELENKIESSVPGYGVNPNPSGKVSDYISGTVTIWVDLGIHVSRGMGYANRAIGSGFFIDKRGYIVTNYHVIQSEVDPSYEGFSRLYIKLSSDPETRIPAKVVGWDPLLDLALLKVEVDAPYVFPLGSADGLKIGDRIFAIGSPVGLDWTLTSGIVSADERRLLAMGPVMQIDAAINSGNSGGPVIDEKGNVEAIAFAGLIDFDGLNFAIPVEYLKLQLHLLAAGGLREHGWIGAYGRDVTKDMFSDAPAGLLIQYLMPGGSGFRAGLKDGDIITAINDTPIDGLDTFHNVLKSMAAETIVKLTVYSSESGAKEEQKGTYKTVPVFLDKRPEQPGYEIYQRDLISNAFLPVLGMQLTSSSDRSKKDFTVSSVLPGGIADESGFSVHDPVKIVKIEISKEKDILLAQLYTKKRKNGYFEVSIAVGSPLDSPYYF